MRSSRSPIAASCGFRCHLGESSPRARGCELVATGIPSSIGVRNRPSFPVLDTAASDLHARPVRPGRARQIAHAAVTARRLELVDE